MNGRWRRALLFANIGFAVAACLYVALWALGFEFFPPVHGWSVEARAFAILAAAGFAAADLVVLYRLYLQRPDPFLLTKTEDGLVSIAITAIEESLARAGRTLPDVSDTRVRIRRGSSPDEPLRVIAYFAAWEDTSALDVSQKLQRALQLRFEQICGTERVPRYSIRLSRFDVKPAGEKPVRPKEPQPADLFRGPQYPTGEEI